MFVVLIQLNIFRKKAFCIKSRKDYLKNLCREKNIVVNRRQQGLGRGSHIEMQRTNLENEKRKMLENEYVLQMKLLKIIVKCHRL